MRDKRLDRDNFKHIEMFHRSEREQGRASPLPGDCLSLIVKENGLALRHIPESQVTEKIALAAVKENGLALQYVKHQSRRIILAAVKENPYAFKFVRKQSSTISLAAVKRHGGLLYYIKKPSSKICLAAVEQDGMALQFIANSRETLANIDREEIYLAAVRQNGLALRFILEQSKDVIREALRQNCCAWDYVIRKDDDNFSDLQRMKGSSILQMDDLGSLCHLHEDLRTAQICLSAVQRDGWELQYVPRDLRSREICLAAVKQLLATIPGEKSKWFEKAIRSNVPKRHWQEISELLVG